jgi:hypothetical protein
MNDLKPKRIQRWENEGGALLPRDCNVHFWKYQDAEQRIVTGHGAIITGGRKMRGRYPKKARSVAI